VLEDDGMGVSNCLCVSSVHESGVLA